MKTRLGLGDADLDGLDGFVRVDGWLLSQAWLETARAGAWEAVEARAGEVDPGLTAAELLGAKPWAGVVAPLLGLEPHLGKLYVPGRLPDASGHGGELAARLAEAGLEPVAVEDADLARQLEREGRLVRLGDGLAIGREAYDEYRRLLIEEFDAAGTITLAAFRDRAGISRRVAQLVLERFDADRLTLAHRRPAPPPAQRPGSLGRARAARQGADGQVRDSRLGAGAQGERDDLRRALARWVDEQPRGAGRVAPGRLGSCRPRRSAARRSRFRRGQA